MGLVIIFVTLVATFVIESNRLAVFLTEQSEAVATADKISNQITKQLRETTDGDDGSYALAEATTGALAFYSDINADAMTEYVKYELVGNDLSRTIIEPSGAPAQYLASSAQSTIVANYIVNTTFTGNPLFSYYDTDNIQLAEPVDLAATTLVRIRLDVNVNPKNIPDTHTISTYVQLRNLNDNL